MHCGVEVSESSTNPSKQHTPSLAQKFTSRHPCPATCELPAVQSCAACFGDCASVASSATSNHPPKAQLNSLLFHCPTIRLHTAFSSRKCAAQTLHALIAEATFRLHQLAQRPVQQSHDPRRLHCRHPPLLGCAAAAGIIASSHCFPPKAV